MYFNTVVDVLTGLAVCDAAAIKETDDVQPDEILEYVVPFLNAYQLDYSIEWLTANSLKVELLKSANDDLKQIASRLTELLESDYSEMNSKHCKLVCQFLNGIKCPFEAEGIQIDLHAIRLYM